MNQNNNKLPAAVQVCHNLLSWIISQLDKMPRLRRYTLGERLETLLLQVLENLIEASYAKSSATVLKRANLKLDTARHLWRLARTLEAVSIKLYSRGCRANDFPGQGHCRHADSTALQINRLNAVVCVSGGASRFDPACVARRRLEQQTRELALREPQQEQPRQR